MIARPKKMYAEEKLKAEIARKAVKKSVEARAAARACQTGRRRAKAEYTVELQSLPYQRAVLSLSAKAQG